MTGEAKSKVMTMSDEAKRVTTSSPPFVEAWLRFWKEFVCERRRHGHHLIADEPARWVWFGLNGPDTEGLLRITDTESLAFAFRNGQWHFAGVDSVKSKQ